MHAHPDADAFVQAILRDPADVATRLVFADWLEETGEPPNVAWAKYIRLCASIAGLRRGMLRENLITGTSEYAPLIRAKLTIPATALVTNFDVLQQLLPVDCIRVNLAGFRPSPHIRSMVSRELAFLYRMFPLDLRESAFLVATVLPFTATQREDVQSLLGVPAVIDVKVVPGRIATAIYHHLPELRS